MKLIQFLKNWDQIETQ